MTRIEHLAQRRDIVATCLEMNALDINQGTSGNVSVRVPEGFLITPSGLPYGDMQPEDIVEMTYDGTYDGERRPSSEWRFHRDILKARRDVEVVVHNHAVFATALSCHGRGIPAFHYMVGVAGGTTIRCAPYATFGTQALSNNALAALEGRYACLLGNHGMITIAATLAKALWLAVEVETMARQYIHALALGEPHILPDDEMARVLEQMRRMSYGQPPDLDPHADVPRRRRDTAAPELATAPAGKEPKAVVRPAPGRGKSGATRGRAARG
jgi:L-fuculose-phosphate aldolase